MSGDAISAARSAYDALTEEQQAQVTNARTLLEAGAAEVWCVTLAQARPS